MFFPVVWFKLGGITPNNTPFRTSLRPASPGFLPWQWSNAFVSVCWTSRYDGFTVRFYGTLRFFMGLHKKKHPRHHVFAEQECWLGVAFNDTHILNKAMNDSLFPAKCAHPSPDCFFSQATGQSQAFTHNVLSVGSLWEAPWHQSPGPVEWHTLEGGGSNEIHPVFNACLSIG